MDLDLLLKILGALGITTIVSTGFTTFARYVMRDWTGDIQALNSKFEEASKLAASIRALAGSPREGTDINSIVDRIQRQALTRLVRRLEVSDPAYTRSIYPLQGPMGALLLVASPVFFASSVPSPWAGRLFILGGIALLVWFAIAGFKRRREIDKRVSSAVDAIMSSYSGSESKPISTTPPAADGSKNEIGELGVVTNDAPPSIK